MGQSLQGGVQLMTAMARWSRATRVRWAIDPGSLGQGPRDHSSTDSTSVNASANRL